MLVTQNEQYFGIVYQASGRAEIEKEEGDVEVVYSQIMQYENEPLAEDKADNNRTDHIGEEANVDGLTPVVLKAHHEKDTVVNSCLVL